MLKRSPSILSLPLAFALTVLVGSCGETTLEPEDDDDDSSSAGTPTPTPTAAPRLDPDLELDAQSLSFGEVSIGNGLGRGLTLSNLGEASLEIMSIALEDSSDVFNITPGGPYEAVPPNASLTLTVEFAPDDDVGYSDRLVIISNDPDSPHTLPLDGAGVSYFVDADGDNYSTSSDCDDTDPSIHPNAPEIPYDGIDQDCTGGDLLDVDRDGFNGQAGGGDDCDDTDDRINPRATEVPYDGIDQDCTGADQADLDGDGFDAEEAAGDDCDDADLNTYPSAREFGDLKDNDCDGQIDEEMSTVDSDGDGYSPADGDCRDEDDTVYPGAIDVPYDGIDQDCSGADLLTGP